MVGSVAVKDSIGIFSSVATWDTTRADVGL